MPAQPQESSSPISIPSKPGRPSPPYSSGMWGFIRPDLVGLRDHVGRMGRMLVVLGGARPDLPLGELPRQRAQAFCSSVSANEIPLATASSVAATGSSWMSIDSSVNRRRSRRRSSTGRIYARPPWRPSGRAAPRRQRRGHIPLRRSRRGRCTAVALAHELRRPRRVEFARGTPARLLVLEWRLRGRRPHGVPAGAAARRPDQARARPGEPAAGPGTVRREVRRRAPDLPEPAWVSDDESPPGEVGQLSIPVRGLRASVGVLVWAPAEATRVAAPAPDRPRRARVRRVLATAAAASTTRSPSATSRRSVPRSCSP